VQWMICLACATNDLAMYIMPTPSRDGRLVYVICRRCEGRRVLPRETWEREETRRRREAALLQGPQAARRGKGAYGHTGNRP
jgi:hypothetical protein